MTNQSNRRKSKPGDRRNRPYAGNRSKNGQSRNRKKARVSSVKPEQLVKKAVVTAETNYVSERRIEELPIAEALKGALTNKGFERPTEIQDRSLEALLEGKDILGIAQTGTGKTGAFLIPIIEELIKKRRKNQALIVVPTRELALQVNEEFRSMTKGLKLFSEVFIGGTNINRDIQKLRRPGNLIVGTPGRLLDLVGRGQIDLSSFKTLVLDEFDRMLDMGFARDVDRIISGMRNKQQTMLFSATLDNSQRKKIDEILNKPVTIKVSSGFTSNDHVEQDIVRLKDGEDKFGKLVQMLGQEDFSRVLLFDETKHQVKRLCRRLEGSGIACGEIHGNKSQAARQRALTAFKSGKIRVLVATDVAARGIDVDEVSHVINYQIPMTYDSYIHRIGRTGRAGNSGKAYTFVA